MPLYEYTCCECSERFEVLQRMGESGEGLSCPRCGANKIQRQLSTFAASTSGASSDASRATAGCGSSPFT
jgi:putative FmdB family regulatory protein